MEKDDLEQLLGLSRENNKILLGMQRSARIGRFFKILYWSLIIGSMVGTYYYIQPYVDQLLKIYGDINSTVSNLKGKAGRIPDPSSFNLPPEILKKLDALFKSK